MADGPVQQALAGIRTTGPAGLSSADVAQRRSEGLANDDGQTSRSVADILRGNLVTPFTFILGALLAVIVIAGAPQDAVFGVILVTNALVGIAQELRAKITLDRMSVLNAPQARVMRDGVPCDIGVTGLVAGDLVCLRPGDQLAADGVLVDGASLQADESLLTGESDPVAKQPGDSLLSGSFVTAGSGSYQAVAVGADAYARKLAAQARQFSVVRSDVMDGINTILRYVTWALGPVAAVVVVSQLHTHAGLRTALTGMVAAVVGMVPQGLVLLTSIAFGVSAMTLARRQVLVQQLPAVEGLARVDVICLDKTGTLTDGNIIFDCLVSLDGDEHRAAAALGALAADPARNATMEAIAAAFTHPGDGWDRLGSVPFSAARKWSAASFDGPGSWVLGAPEMVLPGDDGASTPLLARAADLAAGGQRVLMLAHTGAPLERECLPPGLRAAALVLVTEQLRADAADTVSYFTAQGVAVKVISGDSPATVGAVAALAGVAGADDPVDARSLPAEPGALADLAQQRSVFGRVTPQQKRALVEALQARGHVVAMTGDGVNDVLALKLADIGIAMGSGAPATRAVAELVLLDGRFATLPGVVAEGRRVTSNIERVANLFVTKIVWATLLALTAGAALLPFPFLPRHLTIVDALSIGIPSLFLALAPSKRRHQPGFMFRVLRFAVPAGVIFAAAAFAAYLITRHAGLPLVQQRTAAAMVTLALALTVLVLVAAPLTWRKLLLVALMISMFVLLFPVPAVRSFADLALPDGYLPVTLLIAGLGAAAVAGVWVAVRSSLRRHRG